MRKSLGICGLAAAMALGFSAMAEEPMELTSEQLDGVTAGTFFSFHKNTNFHTFSRNFHSTFVDGYSAESISDAQGFGPWGATTFTSQNAFTDAYAGVSASNGYAASYSR